jgi:ABC-type transport system involved in multi-copper enzyme maturation permease subunit
MMFASLVLEREPLRWADLPGALITWVQDAGMVAALALFIWAIVTILRLTPGLRFRGTAGSVIRAAEQIGAAPAFDPSRSAAARMTLIAALGSLLLYACFGLSLWLQGPIVGGYTQLQQALLTCAGGVALAAVAIPPLRALLFRVQWRRIWALALLSIKEAVRGRVLYVGALMALIFLFAGYFVPYKEENQIRNYVTVVFLPLTIVFLVLAALLGSFSIPRDVVKQTIHTIVTKPVERYEIVLGRFLGNGVLLTAGLFLLTGLSLLYVVRGITAEAAEESFKARIPIEPDRLTFYGTGKEDRGESVGREWDYRSYIRGRPPRAAGQPKQYAIWWFGAVPGALAGRAEPVWVEYTFDIYRTSKADKGKEGVYCTLTFADGRLSVPQIEKRADEARKKRKDLELEAFKGILDEKEIEKRRQQVDDQLIDEFGVYEASALQVVNYHTRKVKVPASLFRKVREESRSPADRPASGEPPSPELKALLSVGDDPNSREQLLGVAKRDLYILAGELPFWQNFLKGAVGLWLMVVLVLGIAIACSTYLSGIISLICTFFLLGLGLFFKGYILELIEGRSDVGGPFQAAWRVFNRAPSAAPMDQSPATTIGMGLDSAYRWLFRFISKVFPDVQRFNLTEYVSSGFNISWTQVLLMDNLLPLVGYLLPWAILAYYLMESREVANPT